MESGRTCSYCTTDYPCTREHPCPRLLFTMHQRTSMHKLIVHQRASVHHLIVHQKTSLQPLIVHHAPENIRAPAYCAPESIRAPKITCTKICALCICQLNEMKPCIRNNLNQYKVGGAFRLKGIWIFPKLPYSLFGMTS